MTFSSGLSLCMLGNFSCFWCLDWLQSLKQFFINVSNHILVASLTLMALFNETGPSELDWLQVYDLTDWWKIVLGTGASLLMSYDDFKKKNLFKKFFQGKLSECQTVWIQFRTDIRGPNGLQRSSADNKSCNFRAYGRGFSSQYLGFISSVWLWHFLIILTIFYR